MDTIEVVADDMQCFMVRADTLEPLSGGYYEPAAWTDPRGPQMSLGEWQRRRADQVTAEMKAYRRRISPAFP